MCNNEEHHICDIYHDDSCIYVERLVQPSAKRLYEFMLLKLSTMDDNNDDDDDDDDDDDKPDMFS